MKKLLTILLSFICLYVNNIASVTSLGRWVINSVGNNTAETKYYFWYKTTVATDSWVTVRVSNLSATRAITIQDFKLSATKME